MGARGKNCDDNHKTGTQDVCLCKIREKYLRSHYTLHMTPFTDIVGVLAYLDKSKHNKFNEKNDSSCLDSPFADLPDRNSTQPLRTKLNLSKRIGILY